jgi:hypothetical protein
VHNAPGIEEIKALRHAEENAKHMRHSG